MLNGENKYEWSMMMADAVLGCCGFAHLPALQKQYISGLTPFL
jgi:hypothetical protein